MFNQMIKKSIHKSQHCNRNWDLSKSIPQEDIDLLIESATQCPVKQNLNYYRTHIFTDRETIENIHSHTTIVEKGVTNSQTLANMLVVFTKDNPEERNYGHPDLTGKPTVTQVRREQAELEQGNDAITYVEDRNQSLGIAIGYVNLVATMLGYETGCCKCFEADEIQKLDDGEAPLVLMGIGFPDNTRSRLEHHDDASYKFDAFKNLREVIVH